MARAGIGLHTVNLPEVPEDALRAAYRTADVMILPSHYEGFGFPLLEAMASGLPVITSGMGALAEVAGDAAAVVESTDVDPYLSALNQLIDNSAWRRQLIESGQARARAFRWAETARRTAEVYRTLV